jgi:lipoprotein-releasing system ATP-binding protein
VARALVMRPKLLLADEPTGNLDGPTGAQVEELLIRLNRELGVTFIVVTHNPALAGRMPVRLRMTDGRIGPDAGAAA